MTNKTSTRTIPAPCPATCDVAVIGGGPSGLAAATRLKQLGINSVHVLERESEAGGIPRHCGHPPFGMREFKRCLTGPDYALRLVQRAKKAGVQIHTNTSVVGLHKAGKLTVTNDMGTSEITPKCVVISTGVRETPRAPRFVSGERPLGVLTTGALQSMIYLKKTIPFKRPVIIGTELVSFSALLTCRSGGIKPAAMIEPQDRITARSFCRPLPILMGVPLYLNTQIVEIIGKERVSAIRLVNAKGLEQTITCDGVLFTGQFTPESSLLRMAHLNVDQQCGGPIVDQFGRCSDPTYFATGNLLRPVETAGWCWQEGRRTADYVALGLANELPAHDQLCNVLSRGPAIKFVVPQVLSLPLGNHGAKTLQLRFSTTTTGRLSVRYGGKTVWSRNISAKPERRVLIPIPKDIKPIDGASLEINFDD